MSEVVNLAALIRREQDKGRSYSDIAKACGLSKAKIGQIARPDTRYQVRAETLEKLATGLRLPVAVVQRAALVTAGVASEPEGANVRLEVILHQLTQLEDDILELVEALVDAAVQQHQKGKRNRG